MTKGQVLGLTAVGVGLAALWLIDSKRGAGVSEWEGAVEDYFGEGLGLVIEKEEELYQSNFVVRGLRELGEGWIDLWRGAGGGVADLLR